MSLLVAALWPTTRTGYWRVLVGVAVMAALAALPAHLFTMVLLAVVLGADAQPGHFDTKPPGAEGEAAALLRTATRSGDGYLIDYCDEVDLGPWRQGGVRVIFR